MAVALNITAKLYCFLNLDCFMVINVDYMQVGLIINYQYLGYSLSLKEGKETPTIASLKISLL